MVSNTSRKDYFVANALEMTPHPNQRLVSVLGEPIMDRRLKYTVLETTLTGSNLTSATPLSLIVSSQGTTDITRIGDRIRLRRIWLTGRLYGAAAAASASVSRILVVLWNPVGVGASNPPVASQVLQGSASYLPFAAYSRDYGDSYQVVYDAVFSANPLSASSEMEVFHLDREITVDATFSAGATTPTTNNLYIFLVSDVSGANQPVITFQSTIWYDDEDA